MIGDPAQSSTVRLHGAPERVPEPSPQPSEVVSEAIAGRHRQSRDPALAHRDTEVAQIGSGRKTERIAYSESQTQPTDSSSQIKLPPVGSFILHYELIRQLGRGGMGTVFLARDTRLGRLVAIKFLTEHNPELSERFIAEARATARFSHENIVVIHDADEYQGHPYMVFEYLQGQTLRQWLDSRSKEAEERALAWDAIVPIRRAAELVLPVVRALVRAHEVGLVHRDLKPENIIITEEGVIKVLDFGVAKPLASLALDNAALAEQPPPSSEPSLTSTGMLVGTLPYMSPEQLGVETVDHRSDIWAVGIMLYELVTGKHPLAPFSKSKLSEVRDLGTPMPSADQIRADIGKLGTLIDRCLRKRKDERIRSAQELLSELGDLLPDRGGRLLTGDQSPYTGLAAFQEEDADRFFGRTQDITSLVTKLRSQPLVALVGPSGAGKSSLVRAGVIPALKRSGEGWESLVFRPGRDPLGALASIVSQLPWQSSEQEARPDGGRDMLMQRFRTEPGFLGLELRAWARKARRRVVLFVDQFEELFTLCADREDRAAFSACLEGVADDAASPLRVILSLRADFLDRAADNRQLMASITRGLMFLPPIDHEGLHEALVRPLDSAGYRFENSDMVEHMLGALSSTRGALPLLQFAAAKLWDSRDRERRLITEASYRSIGGIAGTLSSHADTVLAGMPQREQALARAIFQRLVTPERTRALASVEELRELPGDGDEVERVVQHLADARLIVIETGNKGENSIVEIVHESLIDSWPTLARWLDANQENVAFLARLRSVATQWEQGDRAEGMLWRGDTVREARQWFERYGGELPRRERDYLQAVFALDSRAVRVRRILVGGTMAFLIALVIAAAVAIVWIGRAEREAMQQASLALNRLNENERIAAQLRAVLDQEQKSRQEAEQARAAAEEAAKEAREASFKEQDARLDAENAAAGAREASAKEQEARQEAEAALAKARLAENSAREAQSRAEEANRKLQQMLTEQKQLIELYRKEYGIPDKRSLKEYLRDK